MNRNTIRQQVETELLSSYPSLYRLAFSYVKNPDDAMDAVQDAVTKAITAADSVRDPAVIRSWLCRITVNASLDLLRRRAKLAPEESLPEQSCEDRYFDGSAFDALDVLEEKERTVVTLRFLEELSLQEIADAAQMNLNTVKTTLYRALRKLKVHFTEGM